MAEPNRHYAVGGLLGLLLINYVATWWVAPIGYVIAFASHYVVDRSCPEYWKRTVPQTAIMVAVCGTGLILSYVAVGFRVGWWPASGLLVACLGMDLIDGALTLMRRSPIFCCHPGSRCYQPPWFRDETFSQTIVLACAASVVMVSVVYFIL